uniref:inosine/xanthosine triphosphatase n=1 Tax=Ningiella ruwaisensis TaxID=2364274 RepID=UPI001F4F1963|nr:inosine/xanthosine triphosphatase [Ningiella ruwaisensis]
MLRKESSDMRVVIASKNPVKIDAAQIAFQKVFPQSDLRVQGVEVESGVPNQPMDYEQTRLGAFNRVNHAKKAYPDADFYIAFEGGVDVFEDGPKTFAIVCISNGSRISYGQSATLPLPMSIYERLLHGVELGDAMDALFNTHNIKQKGGAIGQLTQGLETRKSIYTSASILTLSPFVHASLFDES